MRIPNRDGEQKFSRRVSGVDGTAVPISNATDKQTAEPADYSESSGTNVDGVSDDYHADEAMTAEKSCSGSEVKVSSTNQEALAKTPNKKQDHASKETVNKKPNLIDSAFESKDSGARYNKLLVVFSFVGVAAAVVYSVLYFDERHQSEPDNSLPVVSSDAVEQPNILSGSQPNEAIKTIENALERTSVQNARIIELLAEIKAEVASIRVVLENHKSNTSAIE